jgi:uncharacterized repeat protein (TIGR01451 family)
LPRIEPLEDRCLPSSSPLAGSVTQMFNLNFPEAKTNQTQTGTLPRFDPSLGTLTSIDLMVNGRITSDIQVENEDPSPVTVTGIVSGTLNLSGQDFNTVATTSSTSRTFHASSWDGVNDFAGTSGKDFGNLTVPGSKTITLTSPTALADYTGSGSVTITETAVATSSATGGGNLLVKISSTGAAGLTVVYHYLPNADLSIVKTGSPNPVTTKAPLTYTLTVANAGPATANQVTVRDTLPPGVTYVSASGTGWAISQSGGVVTATLPSMAVGASSVITINVKAPGSSGTITNTAVVSSMTPDNNLSNNTSRATTQVITPTILISPDVFPPLPSSFPSPGDLTFLSKLDFLANGGSATADPVLLAQATYVDGLYRTILNRPSDLAGLVTFVRFIRGGGSLSQVVSALWNSDEHRGLEVDHFYQAFFGQNPDPGGRAYWVGVFDSGAGETAVARMLLSSPAFQALHPNDGDFITTLYSDLLGRTVDAGSLAFWQQQLQSGVSRAAVVGALMNSDEAFLHIIDTNYVNILHRGADPGGRQHWLAAFRSGQASADSFSQMLLASGEFYGLAVLASQA